MTYSLLAEYDFHWQNMIYTGLLSLLLAEYAANQKCSAILLCSADSIYPLDLQVKAKHIHDCSTLLYEFRVWRKKILQGFHRLQKMRTPYKLSKKNK